MATSAPPIFGVQTANDLAGWLIPANEHPRFAALSPSQQLRRLANYAHAKREYRVRDVCDEAAQVLEGMMCVETQAL